MLERYEVTSQIQWINHMKIFLKHAAFQPRVMLVLSKISQFYTQWESPFAIVNLFGVHFQSVCLFSPHFGLVMNELHTHTRTHTHTHTHTRILSKKALKKSVVKKTNVNSSLSQAPLYNFFILICWSAPLKISHGFLVQQLLQ